MPRTYLTCRCGARVGIQAPADPKRLPIATAIVVREFEAEHRGQPGHGPVSRRTLRRERVGRGQDHARPFNAERQAARSRVA